MAAHASDPIDALVYAWAPWMTTSRPTASRIADFGVVDFAPRRWRTHEVWSDVAGGVAYLTLLE